MTIPAWGWSEKAGVPLAKEGSMPQTINILPENLANKIADRAGGASVVHNKQV